MVTLFEEDVGYLSVKQAAEMLCVNPSALYQAIRAGRLTTYRVVGKRVLKRADVESYRPRSYRNRPQLAIHSIPVKTT